jgi:uncharacterized protein
MPASRSVAHLDPRAPLVLDTRELGRRAGSMRALALTIPAPAGWGLELVEVLPGEDVHLDLRLEAVMDGVLVTGTVIAPVRAECGRCLEPVHDEVEVDVQELFAYEPDPAGDGEVSLMVGDLIDFEPVVRDALVLGLPLNPVCAEDCSGLCTGCGEQLSNLPEGHNHDEVDPRWAALSSLSTDETPEMGS